MLTVERSTRDVVKLFNIEDTSLYKDIENVRKLAKSIFENNPEVNSMVENRTWIQQCSKDKSEEDIGDTNVTTMLNKQIVQINSVNHLDVLSPPNGRFQEVHHLSEDMGPSEGSEDAGASWINSVLNHSLKYHSGEDDDEKEVDLEDISSLDVFKFSIDDPLIFI